MRIFIFGANGMIGKYLTKYFRDSIPITRERVNALLIRKDLFFHQMIMLHPSPNDVIINLMGITNKRTVNVEEFLVVNSIFPRLLADYCEVNKVKMIHISSDCVYSGSEGMYDESILHNDDNIYGISKSVGEPINCTVIRTSIIGENKDNSLDLLEWVKRHKDSVLQGWVDHIWNGITCLQFAKVCEKIINDSLFWNGVRHVYSPQAVTKAELVQIINEVYELNNRVELVDTENYCNRTLTSNYSDIWNIPPIREQIIEQKNFKL